MIFFFLKEKLLGGEKEGSGDGGVLLMRASFCQAATSPSSVSPQTAHREKEMTVGPEKNQIIKSSCYDLNPYLK